MTKIAASVISVFPWLSIAPLILSLAITHARI